MCRQKKLKTKFLFLHLKNKTSAEADHTLHNRNLDHKVEAKILELVETFMDNNIDEDRSIRNKEAEAEKKVSLCQESLKIYKIKTFLKSNKFIMFMKFGYFVSHCNAMSAMCKQDSNKEKFTHNITHQYGKCPKICNICSFVYRGLYQLRQLTILI